MKDNTPDRKEHPEPRRYTRRNDNGKMAGYSFHPLTARQRLHELDGDAEPTYINHLNRCAPGLCPIPDEHLQLLYHAFKRHEKSLDEAVDNEDPFSLRVTGNVKDWVVEIRIIGDTPQDDVVIRHDFHRDEDMWMIYGYEMQSYQSVLDASSQDFIDSVVGTVLINAAE